MSPAANENPNPRGNAIAVEGLSKRFGRTLALDNISLAVREGELFALLGPNGAGKSTLMLVVSGLLQPDSGSVALSGIDVLKKPRLARKKLGMVFQEPSLDTRLTVAENLEFHAQVFEVPRALRRQRMDELLELVELADVKNRLVRTLSAGMRRRVEIARSLMHDSKVVILDEPTVGLDAQSRGRIWEYLKRLRAERDITLIVTTHYIEEVEGCDRVAIIDRGHVLALDTPRALKEAHGTQSLRLKAQDLPAFEAIRTRFPEASPSGELELVLTSHDESISETLLAEFGQRLRSVALEQSSLESVYLGLTGSAVRDKTHAKAGDQDGRRRGEEPRM